MDFKKNLIGLSTGLILGLSTMAHSANLPTIEYNPNCPPSVKVEECSKTSTTPKVVVEEESKSTASTVAPATKAALVVKKSKPEVTTCGDGTIDKYNLFNQNTYSKSHTWKNPDCDINSPKDQTYAIRNTNGLNAADHVIPNSAVFRFNGEANLTRKQLEDRLLKNYDNNGKSDTVDIYFSTPDVLGEVKRKSYTPATATNEDEIGKVIAIAMNKQQVKGVADTKVADNYANLSDVKYALVLPKVEGSKWPTFVDSKLSTTDVLGYDEDGKLRITKYSYPTDEKSLTLGILYGAADGSIEDHTLSNTALVYAVKLNKGAKQVGIGSDFVKNSGLEGVLANESCKSNQGCTTLTAKELAKAAGNLAAYETTAQILVDRAVNEGIINPEELTEFVENNYLTDYSKSLFGILTPTNTIIRMSTGSTGLNRSSAFKSIYKEQEKSCMETQSNNAIGLFNCMYDGIKADVIEYNNGGNQK